MLFIIHIYAHTTILIEYDRLCSVEQKVEKGIHWAIKLTKNIVISGQTTKLFL